MFKNARVIAVLLAIALLVSFTAACKDNSAEGEDGRGTGTGTGTGPGSGTGSSDQDLIYLPEFFSIPIDSPYIDAFAFADDKVYISATFQISGDDDGFLSAAKIFSMDLDGSNVTELTGYAPEVSGADFGGVGVRAMTIDNDGNIWINENAWLYNFNLPDDFDGEEHEKYQYSEDAGSYNNLVKLDSNGNTQLSFNIDSFLGGEFSWISSIKADGDGNVYVMVSGAEEGTIIVFADDGTHRGNIKILGHNSTLVKLSDGNMAYAGYSSAQFEFSLRKIDLTSQSLGTKLELPHLVNNVYSGGARFLYLYSDSSDLYGVDSDSGDTVHLLNWLESYTDISSGDYRDLTMLPDERIATINTTWDNLTHESSSTLAVFTKVPRVELPDQTVLTLAAFGLSQKLQEAVVLFNRADTKYRINVIDYNEFSTEDNWNAGIDRLTTEIITGNAPDIIITSNLPISRYAARGLLEDLYTFIDNDPEYSRSDFLESVFRNAEMNGGLYQIFSSFSLETVIGNPLVVGHEPGWNIEEFKAVLAANPKADMPMGQWYTGGTFLTMSIIYDMDKFVNWADGTVNFETDEFIQLLEAASKFPADYSHSEVGEDEFIATGRQIMMTTHYYSFDVIQIHRAIFGGDIVFKGYPSESRRGNSLSVTDGLAITTGCKDKEGAWEFIRTLLSKEWQNSLWHGFPTNKAAFEELQNEAMKEKQGQHTWTWGNITIDVEPTTQEEADRILTMIDSARGPSNYDTTLLTIVQESVGDFFEGRRTAQDVARIIQNRASIYVSEQSG